MKEIGEHAPHMGPKEHTHNILVKNLILGNSE